MGVLSQPCTPDIVGSFWSHGAGLLISSGLALQGLRQNELSSNFETPNVFKFFLQGTIIEFFLVDYEFHSRSPGS